MKTIFPLINPKFEFKRTNKKTRFLVIKIFHLYKSVDISDKKFQLKTKKQKKICFGTESRLKNLTFFEQKTEFYFLFDF